MCIRDRWVKCFAAVAAIAYISGYLTATTYMGTYGIHVGSDDLFRAKYVYIGFHYWLFITALVLFIILMRRCFVWFKQASTDSPDAPPVLSPEELSMAADSFWETDLKEKEYRSFRWACVVSVLLAAFTSEIMFVNPPHISRYIPLQAIMLFNVLIFQVERYAWLSPYGPYADGRHYYIWGRLYCEKWIKGIRDLAAGMVILAASLMLRHRFVQDLRARHSHLYWVSVILLIGILSLIHI